MPVDHYENFPVASFLLPAHLREPVEAIYAFARSADDIADEGDAEPIIRLARLNDYRRALIAIEQGRSFDDPSLVPIFERLGRNIRTHKLPLGLFRDLLDAFSQDVGKTRYADFDELLDYCRRSANPVGRLLLHLYKADTPDNLVMSDQICTSLQLINFWQDVAVDWQKQRIYLPLADMTRFGVSEDCIARGQVTHEFTALMDFQIQRARCMMLNGAPLTRRLPGRLGWELRLVVQGGLAVLDKIEANGYDVFRRRPALGKTDWLRLAWRAATR
ncbi:squalene synthase HpnC [Zoogloea dura]|jgi:squalene synthase HpnC|uniref:Squalene synthase HpnC n=1 Tax=Zoogloea dura TaxID=2728840 RepID=A0A848GDN1_9RHOO|nr:squalene synthase HpnC [Zoogloea dura]NML27571.1 squalene synthase HpnC [Zoogloea dura]